MQLKVRLDDGTTKTIQDVSKSEDIKVFKDRVFKLTGIEPKLQFLLYSGKVLVDGCDLCDYKLQDGHIIQLKKREILAEMPTNQNKSETVSEGSPSTSSNGGDKEEETLSKEEEKRRLIEIGALDLVAEIDTEEAKPEPPCKRCKGNDAKKCKECGCTQCGGKDRPEVQLFCEQCQFVTHMDCLEPPLETIPDDDWYCPDCFNDGTEIVQAGQKVGYSKTRVKMGTKRDWGKGYATAGKTKTCTIVSNHHFGPIPGVEVGMNWLYRIQACEVGVHRPPVAGIAGSGKIGCQSIVLAGGYEDDVDDGDEFYYTGSGGRDLSGNKRVSGQSSDQELTRSNQSIAMNCDCDFNDKDGGEADKWKRGKPIRVIRSCKLAKHSKFAPAEGIRYDGIYKVVKYWPHKGKAGFIVWRYLFRRDDPSPAPWEEGAKKFKIKIPDAIKEKRALEALKENKSKQGTKKRKADMSPPNTKSEKNFFDKKGKKAKLEEVEEEEEKEEEDEKAVEEAVVEEEEEEQVYEIESDLLEVIKADTKNKKLWKECIDHKAETKFDWLEKIEEEFACRTCYEVLFRPITTVCGHNNCKSCLRRAFKANKEQAEMDGKDSKQECSACRTDLGADFSLDDNLNQECATALLKLFPGYNADRK